MRHRRAVVLSTIFIVVTFVVFAIAGFFLSGRLSRSTDPGGRRITFFAFAVVVFGAIFGVMLFISMTYFVMEDTFNSEPVSKLFWPIYCIKALLPAELFLTMLQGTDAIVHHYERDGPTALEWHILYTPGARLVQALGILGVVASLAWLHATMLSARGWKLHRVVYLILGMTCISVSYLCAVLIWAHLD